MHGPHRLEVRTRPHGCRTKVLLDDMDISGSLRSFDLHAPVDGAVTVTLGLIGLDVAIDGKAFIEDHVCFICGKPARHWITRLRDTTTMGEGSCHIYKSLGAIPFCDEHVPSGKPPPSLPYWHCWVCGEANKEDTAECSYCGESRSKWTGEIRM